MTASKSPQTTAAVVVEHPDDETLWTGGTILHHPQWCWYVITLCRADDADRAPRFHNAVKALNAEGFMGSLNDGEEQAPLNQKDVRNEIISHLPQRNFDLVITHDPQGEYTRHKRHEETSEGVCRLIKDGVISTKHLWTFAYEDGGKKYLPRARKNVDYLYKLPRDIWLRKYEIITKIYGFSKTSFESRTAPRKEAFRCFKNVMELETFFQEWEKKEDESSRPF